VHVSIDTLLLFTSISLKGHTVKNAAAAQSKACMAVAAERRWVCTGTPLNNDIMDLLGQFAVLHMQPLGSKPFFDSRIKPAFTGHGYGVSLVPLLYMLRHSMVRHTKAQTIAGVSVLALPEKTEELVEGKNAFFVLSVCFLCVFFVPTSCCCCGCW
jgi:SNF2 family DNA or RNA helicase